jgi:3-deoxy-D-manno-octulosonate 8-phosphate phosphatase KdsC-like HAD superfamily phosphatase
VAHVGDGWSDAEVFRQVGGGVALNSPLVEVNRAADLALTTEEFPDVVAALARLAPRP